MSDDTTVHCPQCGSDDIREKNVAYTELRVWAWEIEDGHPTPCDYDTDSSPEWEVSDARDQYVCGDCRWEGNTGDLKVNSTPEKERS